MIQRAHEKAIPRGIGERNSSRHDNLPGPGALVNQYRLGQFLGNGATSAAYVAADVSLNGRPVVLKFTTDCEMELRIACEDLAKNVPEILETFEYCGRTVIVYRFFSRTTLREHISKGVSLPVATGLAKSIAAGLANLHALTIAHGDLKPENILVAADCSAVQFIDFNASITFGSPVPTAIGTLPYLAPERLHEAEEHSVPVSFDRYAGDLYSFGVICLELFGGKTDPSPISKVPICLRRLVIGCLSEDPYERLRAFNDWLSTSQKKSGGLKVMSLVAAVTIAVSLCYWFLQHSKETDWRQLIVQHRWQEARTSIRQLNSHDDPDLSMNLGMISMALIADGEYEEAQLGQMLEEARIGRLHASQNPILLTKYDRMRTHMEMNLAARGSPSKFTEPIAPNTNEDVHGDIK